MIILELDADIFTNQKPLFLLYPFYFFPRQEFLELHCSNLVKTSYFCSLYLKNNTNPH